MKTDFRARALFAVVALQVVVLLGWAGYHEWVRSTGPTVRLRTAPVDPRDILRGDFMILNYDISRQAAPAGWGEHSGLVYVMLKPDDRFLVIDELRKTPPTADDPRPWVEATASNPAWSAMTVRLDYGIEKFFVPEGKGTPSFKQMEVEVTLARSHRFYLRRVWLDGRVFP